MDHSKSSLATGSLPVPLTSLIGREREIGELTALLLRAEVRLVTLTGPGGVGKTRLAVAATTALQNHFPGGMWFVDLAPITDPALVLPTIARTMGLRDAGELTANEWIASFLGDKQVLLILDNVEQIISAALDIVRLPAESSSLTVLITSRIRLRVTGEHQYPVLPLTLPVIAGGSTPYGAFAAVQLFIERAQATQPDFCLEDSNAAAVAGICHRLDGLPLAIELAAARVSMFAPSAILHRLEQQLPLLTCGARDLPDRQQTMHNAIVWSYNLLGEHEQALLRRLALFVGGFTIEAAESIGTVAPPVPDVLLSLTHLIDQSLVRKLELVIDEQRFGMLETVREFGLGRLTEAGEHQPAVTSLVTWATDFMEQVAGGMLDYPQQSRWRAAMDADLDNVRIAINWMIKSEDHAGVLSLVARLEEYWSQRPNYLEVLQWLEISLAAATAVDPLVRAEALSVASWLASWSGQPQKAIEFAEQGIKIGQETDNPLVMGRHLIDLGVAWEARDDPARSLAYHTEALPYLEKAGAPVWLGIILTEIADRKVQLGSVVEALPYFEEALRLMVQEGYVWGIALVKSEQAFAALAQGMLFDAASLFSESHRLGQECGDPRFQLGAAAGLAGVALAIGDGRHSAVLLGAVEEARISNGIVRILHSMHIQSIRVRVQSLLGETAFHAALAEGRSLPLQQAVDDLLAVIRNAEVQTVSRNLTDPNGLTPREGDVLRLLIEGRSDREIAETLFIGSRTVQTHVSNLLAKLGVANRAEAAAVAVRNGLV